MKVVAGNATGLIELEQAPADGEPGLHALIIGVSNYPALSDPRNKQYGMSHVPGPAAMAFKLAEFLAKFNPTRGRLAAPLRSLRLLLSPTPKELGNGLVIPPNVPQATDALIRDAVLCWRRDAATNEKNVTLFYFAGHGVQRGSAEGVLLPEDALTGHPPAAIMSKTFDVNNFYNGMAPMPSQNGANETIARTQYFFFDACRSPCRRYPNSRFRTHRRYSM